MAEVTLTVTENTPAVGSSWAPAERELAQRLRATHSIREISKALDENGFDRTPKAIEKFFERIGLTREDARKEAGLEPDDGDPVDLLEEIYKQGFVKTTWGEPMLVTDKKVEFGHNTSVVPVVFLPDIHVPYQDDRAIELACKIIEAVKPTTVVYLGDNVDWHQLSKFNKDPDRITQVQNEIDTFHRIDRDIMSAAGMGIPRYYILGNHEDRLRRYQCEHHEISKVRGLQFDAMLGLGPTYQVIPDLQIIDGELNWRDGRFIAKHGSVVRKWPGYSARAEIEKENTSGISGHTHRAAVCPWTTRGSVVSWYESGCLCGLDPQYVRNPNWQQAVTVGYFNGDRHTDFFHLDLILFSKYQAIVNGQHLSVKESVTVS